MKRETLTLLTITTILLLEDSKIVKAVCQPFCNNPSPWIEQETNVCYGAKDKKPGVFSFKQDCQLYAIRLRHVSGLLSCWTDGNQFSRWGCLSYRPSTLKVILVNPENEKLWFPTVANGKGYIIDGFQKDDDVLVIKKKGNFTAGDRLQVWYDEDWFSLGTHNNGGLHCINVDVSCYT